MTEYDYSEEGYQRYLTTQTRVSNWVDKTNAASRQFAHAVPPPVQSTPSQVATRHRTRERSYSETRPYDLRVVMRESGGRLKPVRSKTLEHHYHPPPSQSNPLHASHQSTGHRTSSRAVSPPYSSHVSKATTPQHSRPGSRSGYYTTANTPIAPTPPYQRQFHDHGPSKHTRSSSAAPADRSRTYHYTSGNAPPARPIPVPQPVSAVMPPSSRRDQVRRSKTLPPDMHSHLRSASASNLSNGSIVYRTYDPSGQRPITVPYVQGGQQVVIMPGVGSNGRGGRGRSPAAISPPKAPQKPLLKRLFTGFKT